MKTLWSLAPGKSAEITAYDTKLAQRVQTRLTELGFQPGERVSCLMAPSFGAPRLYQVGGMVYSLDDQIASHITIAEQENA